MENKLMTIGELAKQLGVTVRTLQYYDKEGLLKPTSFSQGGRRLYSEKDMIRLHQILSFKYLGFSLDEIRNQILSLDSPQEIAAVLQQQQLIVEEQIKSLQAASYAIDALRNEVLAIHTVDFKKYAEIIELLKMNNKEYWVWKLFDNELANHVQKKFIDHPDEGTDMIARYKDILEQAVILKRSGEQPTSEKSILLAEKWWTMVMDFTEGDLTLLPRLYDFNQQKEDWNAELANKQAEIDEYIGLALQTYFIERGIEFPETE